MTAFMALVRKQMMETRWFLGLVSLAMGGLGWLGVYQTMRYLAWVQEDQANRMMARGMMRFMGGPSFDNSVLALEIARWNFPVVPLLVLSWAIARGSAAVSGELERGTLDLAMSRPMSRWTYLMAQVVSSLLGLTFMMLVLWLSNLLANRFYGIEEMPSALGVLRPCVNIFALGASVFGYTLLFSSFDVVRWRASLLGSAITIAGLVGYSVATADEFKERWGWLEWLTVFRGYAPVEAAVKAEQFGPNVGALCGVCAAGIIIAYLFFQGRDLPANS